MGCRLLVDNGEGDQAKALAEIKSLPCVQRAVLTGRYLCGNMSAR